MISVPFKYKIIIGFFVVEFIFLSFIIIYNYISIQNFTKELINNNIKTNKVLLTEMVKTPVMIYDLATLDNMLEKFAELQNIEAIKIYDVRNRLLSEYNDKKSTESDIRYINDTKFELKEDNDIIGSVEMIFNLTKANSKIEEHTKAIIKIALVEIFLSILVAFLIGKKLSEHLNILDKAVKDINISNTEIKKININSKDEFEDLANSFNIMQTRIKNEVEKNTKQNMKLLEQSRLASMGEMIGNIAHQWRQPLSAISTGATGIKLQKEFDALTDEHLLKTCDMINTNAQYLSKTIDDFREFIQNDRKKVSFNLSNCVESFLTLIEGTIVQHDIKIVKNIQEGIVLDGYPNELIQCCVNIFNNSKDALKENKNLHKFVFIDAYIEDKKLYLILKDNAGGIKDSILPHIFEPYFTTKHQSQGTGIGLTMTYRLIKDGMGGSIMANNSKYTYNNKVYKGAEFKIILDI